MDSVPHTGPSRLAGCGRALRAAVRFLLPVGGPEPEPPLEPERILHWIVPFGLLIGVLYAVLFGFCWRVYGEYFGLRLIPAAVALIADAAFFGQRLLRGTCTIASEADVPADPARRSPGFSLGTLALVLSVLLKFAIFLTLPRGQPWSPGDWRRHLMIIYPQPVLRPFLLMPLWGRWSLLLAMSIGRPQPGQPTWLSRTMASAKLSTVLGWLAPCVALTVLYCTENRGFAAGLLISGLTLLVTYLASVGLCWRHRGQTLASIYATGAVGEIAFLLAYAPFASRIHNW